VKWDRPTQEILKALNDEGSIAKAAKSLKTTTVTLTKAIQRHHIIQRWVVDKEAEGAGTNGQHVSRRDADLIQA
jgi:molybdenum-dependent DNA-binding transcriptional regulator ModE